MLDLLIFAYTLSQPCTFPECTCGCMSLSGLFIAWLMEGDPSKARGVPGKIWACEPLPANLARLRSNLDQHGLTDTVSIICDLLSVKS